MASQDGGGDDHHSSSNLRPVAPTLLLSKKPRSSDDARRNRMNMEKMIMRNVAIARNSTKNRAQQIVEALKKKRQLQEEAVGPTQGGSEEVERATKRKKTSSPSSDTAARTAVAAGILSPARRSNTSGPNFTSPTRRHNYPLNMKSPTPQMASPARARVVNPLHMSSPVRPPRSSVQASPARPRRSSNTASPLRRSEFLTSPLRHRASASPKRPLMFDDATMTLDTSTGITSSTKINGHPPLLSSALDQVDVVPPAKSVKVVRTAKSPFQSFQAKFNKSPAKAPRPSSSPAGGNSAQLMVPRSGPMLNLTQPDESISQYSTATSAASSDANAVLSSESSAPASSVSAAPSSLMPIKAETPTLTPDRASSTPTQPPKPVRKLFPSSRPVVSQRSICFSTEGVATALDVSPDGEIIVVGFQDGSVRLYEMDSSVPSDRHGYLLGHIDEQSSQGSSNVHLRVKISPDGRYVFVGCRQGPRVVMSINLDNYRNQKDGDAEDFQQFQKHFYTNSRLRGFADVTTYVPPAEIKQQESSRSAYYILTGLGVGNLNLWRFVEPGLHQEEPIWEHLQNFGAGGNTAMMGAFLPSSISPGVLAIAAICSDKNMRVWPLEFEKMSSDAAVKTTEDCANEDDTTFLGGAHSVSSHFNMQNTTDIKAIHGQHAYGISLMGEAYRICFPDSSKLSSKSCERLTRQEFELEKLGGGGGSGKSRRSNIMLEELAASDDGKAIIAMSTEGIFYYSNSLPDVGSSEVADLRIIGKNASKNSLFKAPMKVYCPTITTKGKKSEGEAMMTVVTNPSGEDSDEMDGYINVDPTEVFAARWMVPSRGRNCWVCGVRNVSHWIGPPESKVKKEPQVLSKTKERLRAQRQRERERKRAQDAAQRYDSADDPETPTSGKRKATPRSSAKKAPVQAKQVVESDASADSVSVPPRPPPGKKRRISQSSNAGGDDDEEYTGSDDNAPSIASLMNELEHFKKRNAEIKTEWQRRLQGERQLRRKWKEREEEFLDQLNDSLTKLDTAEVEADRLRVLLRDAEKRFAFEKVRVEQENSVKCRYEQLCEQMNDKLALVADQKRLLEQTTRSLLTEVDRNVHALKNAVILEKTECVVCKDQQAVTAVVPCGHLCFCEQDAETYRRNCTTEYPTCPICQQEIVSLLRIYT
ncbi:RNA-binding E3 ubiquitin-protein ligase MEX3C [Phytophthora citrophthora]|uniref:RNA-binding E3 ubiquitin-protein ligase MEX3C n=1 Tax=Phytophthora citrophthora TaxID=4793 RepID=A0AAD9GSL3_9STRA|nr:RNA-binding E3 ubiquitin-protein ligase MEX3C [Phytophthora citrophthora]